MDLKKVKLEALKKKLVEGHKSLAKANEIFLELYNIITQFEEEKDKNK